MLLIQTAAEQFGVIIRNHLNSSAIKGDKEGSSLRDKVTLDDDKVSLEQKIRFWQRYYLLKLTHILQWLVHRQVLHLSNICSASVE